MLSAAQPRLIRPPRAAGCDWVIQWRGKKYAKGAGNFGTLYWVGPCNATFTTMVRMQEVGDCKLFRLPTGHVEAHTGGGAGPAYVGKLSCANQGWELHATALPRAPAHVAASDPDT